MYLVEPAMKAVDPTILLMGPELSGSYTSNFAANPKDASGRDWMTEFLKANGDPANPAHWETWTSPNFTIDRP